MPNAGETVLINSIVEEEMESSTPGVKMVAFKLNGEGWAAAIVSAIAYRWRKAVDKTSTEIGQMLIERLDKKVTLVYAGENQFGVSGILAREGRLFQGSYSGGVALMPKGATRRGYSLDVSRIIDVYDGYVTATLQERCEELRAQLPQLQKLTQERFAELPPYRPSGDIHACFFGSWNTPEGLAPEAIWLVGAYHRGGDDIVDNSVLLIPPEWGVSETGSVYGQQLLRAQIGEVVGFPGMKFRDAVDLTNLDYEEAAAKVFELAATPA